MIYIVPKLATTWPGSLKVDWSLRWTSYSHFSGNLRACVHFAFFLSASIFFSVVPYDERAYVASYDCLEKKLCSPRLTSSAPTFFCGRSKCFWKISELFWKMLVPSLLVLFRWILSCIHILLVLRQSDWVEKTGTWPLLSSSIQSMRASVLW